MISLTANNFKLSIYNFLRSFLLDDKFIMKFIPPGSKYFLDLGCGYGHSAYTIAKSNPGMQVVGIDPDRNRLSTAKKNYRLKNLVFFNVAAEKFSTRKKFDLVVAVDLFHHVPYDAQAAIIANIKKLLSDNGIFLMREVNKESKLRPFNTMHDRILNNTKTHYRTVAEWKELLKKFGLKSGRATYDTRFWYPYFYLTASKSSRSLEL
jgi:2-polyprenyl-3-methyl-5-hydroxy-6-metoxy-1,4-benzoquinol methylase